MLDELNVFGTTLYNERLTNIIKILKRFISLKASREPSNKITIEQGTIDPVNHGTGLPWNRGTRDLGNHQTREPEIYGTIQGNQRSREP